VQSRPQGGDTKDRLSTGPRRESALSDQPTDTNTDLTTSESAAIQPVVECKGIRPIKDFPRDLTGLSPEQIEHHYKALRNSHISLNRSRGQLLRRSRELIEARERFLTTLRGYEERLVLIGQEKAEAMRLAQDMHQELEAFDSKQQALDKLLQDLDDAKQEAGFWSIFQISELIERMRAVLRGKNQTNG
jgi:prefoldin subunit 5